jgi:ribosome-associated protein
MDPLEIRPNLVIPPDELHADRVCSGGPGGQHVNTTASKVRLTWGYQASRILSPAQKEWLRGHVPPRFFADGGATLHVACDEERSQHLNLEACRERLVSIIRQGLHRPKLRIKTKPGRAAKARRVDAKSAQGKKKQNRQVRHDD